MNWIQNMNRCVGPASWDASKPKEKDMNTQEVPDWMIDATNIPKAEALQTLAHRLPDGWNIQIDIERGAGSVTLYAPEDTMYEIDTGGESIEADMLEALRFACWREKQTELAVDRAWAQFKTAMRFNVGVNRRA